MERGSKSPLAVNIRHMLVQKRVAKYLQIRKKLNLELDFVI